MLGALEVPHAPSLDYHGNLKPVEGKPRLDGKEESTEEEILEAWKDLRLRNSFVSACETMPVESSCSCLRDDVRMTHDLVLYLNEHWVPAVNKKLKQRGFFVDAFLWKWNNIHGRATTNILLIRFHEVPLEEVIPKVIMVKGEQFSDDTISTDGSL